MKESYGEGIANHTSLESCGNCSNAVAEALTEGSIGGLLSSEITNSRVPATWSVWEDESVYIPLGEVHRLENPEKNLSTFETIQEVPHFSGLWANNPF